MLRRLRLPIAEPCHENWDAMDGDGPRRFCDACQTQVTNLSDMSEGEAQQFLRVKAGKNVCVRYRSDREGNIKFNNPSVAAPAPTAMSGWRATLAAAAGLAAVALGGCTGERYPDRVDSERCTYDMGPFSFELRRGEGNCPPENEHEFVMGAIAPEPVTPDPVEKMGKIAIEDPPEVMGEAPIAEPEPEPEPLMGDIAVPEDALQGQAPVPCDGEPPAPTDAEGDAPSRPQRF